MTSKEVQAKKSELGQIEARIRELGAKAIKLRKEILVAEARFKVGDRVTFKHACRQKWGLVTDLKPGCAGCTDYRIIPDKKDGTGGAAITVTDWEYSHMKLEKKQ